MTNTRSKEMGYLVAVLDDDNQAIAVYDDLVEVSYRKQCNKIGMAVLTVPEGHPILDLITDDVIIVIYITYSYMASGPARMTYTYRQKWQVDFEGLYRDRQITTDADGNIYYLLYFPSMIEILSRYTVAWPGGVNDRSDFSGLPLAIVASHIVLYNCTDQATVANGRLRTATVIHDFFGYVSSIAGTPVRDYTVGNRNVLEVMQELAPICGFDFDVVRRTTAGYENEYFMMQYPGQLGFDRSARIIFDMALDNLSSANMLGDRLREKTVAIVGGLGAEGDRSYVIRTGDNYSATNDYEMFVDASTEPTIEKMEAVGDARLGELKATAKVSASVISSRGYIYGKHYEHGDLVTVQIGDVSLVRKIDAVDVTFSQNQRVDVRLEFANP